MKLRYIAACMVITCALVLSVAPVFAGNGSGGNNGAKPEKLELNTRGNSKLLVMDEFGMYLDIAVIAGVSLSGNAVIWPSKINKTYYTSKDAIKVNSLTGKVRILIPNKGVYTYNAKLSPVQSYIGSNNYSGGPSCHETASIWWKGKWYYGNVTICTYWKNIYTLYTGHLSKPNDKSSDKPTTLTTTDCGSDRDCFLTALDNCEPVRATDENTHYNVTTVWGITGSTGIAGVCLVNVVVTNASNPVYPGKGVNCTMSRDSLFNFFQGGGDTCWLCSGSLMDATGVCGGSPQPPAVSYEPTDKQFGMGVISTSWNQLLIYLDGNLKFERERQHYRVAGDFYGENSEIALDTRSYSMKETEH
jgi:hypothetical protein